MLYKAVLVTGLLVGTIQAQVLVAKQLSTRQPVLGQPFSVDYHFYNTGTDSVLDLELVEDSYGNDEGTKNGEKDKNTTDAFITDPPIDPTRPFRLAQLKPGERSTHHVVVTPKVAGQFEDRAARITYRRAKPSQEEGTTSSQLEEVILLSTSYGLLKVLTAEEYHLLVERHYREWITFSALALLLVIGPSISYLGQYRQLAAIEGDRDKSS